MLRIRAERVLSIVGAAALLVVGFDGVTYAATGSSLILGKINSSSAVTTIKNTGSGAAISLITKSTASAPLTTNAHGKVSNLYADRAAIADNATRLGGHTLAQIQIAAKGDKGDPGVAGPKGDPGSAFPTSLPTGATVTGNWGYLAHPAASAYLETSISWFWPTRTPVTFISVPVGGSDSTCTGTAAAPTAPAGYLCVYVGYSTAAGASPFLNDSWGNSGVQIANNIPAGGNFEMSGSWAVTGN